MENIRRSIKLFFVVYGNLLSQIIGVIAIIIFTLQGINYFYKENTVVTSNKNTVSEQEIIEKQETVKKESEDILFISEFLDYCNNKQLEEAYGMLSDECIQKKYKNISIFKTEYIDKIFVYKKEYEIQKEGNLYKIIILEGVLESGGLDNRDSIISYYQIKESVIEKKIFIER